MSNEVICDICKQSVSKRQTLSIGKDKRACRSHPGVEDMAAKSQRNIKEREKTTARRPRPHLHSMPQELDLRPKCFGCGVIGLRSDDFHFQLLKLGEKYQLTYGKPLNPFDGEECKKAYSELKGLACLWIVPFDPKMWLHTLATKQAAQMLGVVALCDPCCRKFKIDPRPDVNFEQLTNLGVVLDLFIRPVIKAAAAAEIAQRN